MKITTIKEFTNSVNSSTEYIVIIYFDSIFCHSCIPKFQIINNIKKSNNNILIYQIIRDSIDLMVKDLINNTIKNIKKYKIKNVKDVFKNQFDVVNFSEKFKNIEKETKFFLRTNMYNNKNVLLKNNKGKKIIKTLFKQICKKPNHFIDLKQIKENKFRAISDYISGMTDRFAINLYKKII